MKRIFALLFGLLLIGAGCSTGAVEGDWYLTFDLPDEWVMVQAYKEGNSPEGVKVTDDQVEIFLQSADTHMIFGGRAPEPEEVALISKEVQSDDMIKISVTRLDSHRLVPSEAEDLGDGWYSIEPCGGEECDGAGQNYMTHYLETEEGDKYLFRPYVSGREFAEAEEVIFTAEEVTVTE